MQMTEQIVPIGDRLVQLAREFTDDANEAYLIAHKALRTLLRNETPLSGAEGADLRAAVTHAAKALGIEARDKPGMIDINALIWPQRPDLVL